MSWLGRNTSVRLPSRLGLWRFILAVTAAAGLLGLRELWLATHRLSALTPVTTGWLAFCAGSALLALLGLLASLRPSFGGWLERRALPPPPHRGGRVAWGILAGLSLVPLVAMMLNPYFGELLVGRTWLKLDLLWLQSLLLALAISRLGSRFEFPGALAAAVIAQAALYRTLVYIPDISSYPLSLGYSEASRYYTASLFFGKLIYGKPTAWPVLHPTLHLLLSLPFLIPHSPILLHRLWQVILRTGLIALTGVVLARRMQIDSRAIRWTFAAWAYLFLFQGPIYLHLTIPVILMVAAFDVKRSARSWAVLLIASVWAGLSRINWIPVPGLFAAAIYFLEQPLSASGGSWLSYLRRPVFWFLGGCAAGIAVWRLYMALSGNPAYMFTSSFSSALLWYRLLPTLMYPLGVLPGALLLSLPAGLFIFFVLRNKPPFWHALRLAGLGAALLVLLAGGLVVSTKIGGGADVHNLDAYISLLLFITSALFWGQYAPEMSEPGDLSRTTIFPWQALAFAILVPVFFALQSGAPIPQRDPAKAEAAIAALRARVQQAQAGGGQVLFISERQLLTFGDLPGTALVEPYEKEILAEMSMARNQAYLDGFYQALREHRYALIVTDYVSRERQDASHPWSEENNNWLKEVGRMLLCTYQLKPVQGLEAQVYIPKAGPHNCSKP